MTTIIIDNPKIEKKYSEYEIKMKFIKFLEKDMKNEKIDLYEISESNLSSSTQERLKNIDSLNFTEY
jgi:GTP cyclohydrolase FolE2